MRLFLGSFIMGIGISIAMKSGLGVDPMALFWEGIHIQTKLSYGLIQLMVSFVLIFMIYMIDKSQIGIGTIVNSLVVSFTMDYFDIILSIPDLFSLRIVFFVLGLLCLAIGIAYYGSAHYGRGAFDGLVFGITSSTSLSIRLTRFLCDLLLVIAGVLCGAKIRIGPILSVLCLGPMIQCFNSIFNKNE